MLMKSKFIDCRKFADCTGDRRAASERRPSRCWRRASGATLARARAHKVSVAGFASGLRAGVPGWAPRTERGWERCFRRKAGHFSISAVVVSYVRALALSYSELRKRCQVGNLFDCWSCQHIFQRVCRRPLLGGLGKCAYTGGVGRGSTFDNNTIYTRLGKPIWVERKCSGDACR